MISLFKSSFPNATRCSQFFIVIHNSKKSKILQWKYQAYLSTFFLSVSSSSLVNNLNIISDNIYKRQIVYSGKIYKRQISYISMGRNILNYYSPFNKLYTKNIKCFKYNLFCSVLQYFSLIKMYFLVS